MLGEKVKVKVKLIKTDYRKIGMPQHGIKYSLETATGQKAVRSGIKMGVGFVSVFEAKQYAKNNNLQVIE